MDEIRHFINELLTGYRIIHTQQEDNSIILARGFTGHERIIQKIEYEKALLEAVADGMSMEKDLLASIQELGLWTKLDEISIQTYNINIEKLKNQISSFKYKKALKKKTEERLEKERASLNKILYKKHTLLSGCAERWAEQRCLFWNINNVLFDLDKKKLWANQEDFLGDEKDKVEGFISSYLKSFYMDQKTVREIARSGSWRIFYSECNDPTTLFGRRVQDLDENQINVLFWSSVYDNARKAHEPPDEETFNNDDLFDEWSERQHKEYIKSMNKRRVDQQTSNKSKTSGKNKLVENFVMTDQDGAKDFYGGIS